MDTMRNSWYNRPDLKPKAAMVKDTSLLYDEVAYSQMMEQNHTKSMAARLDKGQDETKKSPWYRLLKPFDADFTLKQNLYNDRPAHTNYNKKTGAFPNVHNNYTDHLN